jgi:hypothetical protein
LDCADAFDTHQALIAAVGAAVALTADLRARWVSVAVALAVAITLAVAVTLALAVSVALSIAVAFSVAVTISVSVSVSVAGLGVCLVIVGFDDAVGGGRTGKREQ